MLNSLIYNSKMVFLFLFFYHNNKVPEPVVFRERGEKMLKRSLHSRDQRSRGLPTTLQIMFTPGTRGLDSDGSCAAETRTGFRRDHMG